MPGRLIFMTSLAVMAMLAGPVSAAASYDDLGYDDLGQNNPDQKMMGTAPNGAEGAAFIHALRLDRYDGFASSVTAFADAAGLLDISAYLSRQNQSRYDAVNILKTAPRGAGQPFGSWVDGLLGAHPEHGYQLLSALERQYPYQAEAMRAALARYLMKSLPHRPPAQPELQPIPEPDPEPLITASESAPAVLSPNAVLPPNAAEPQSSWPALPPEAGFLSLDDFGPLYGPALAADAPQLGFGTSAAVGAAGLDVTTVALYSLGGALAALAGDWDGSSCSTCGQSNTIMSQNPEVFEDAEYLANTGLSAVNASSAYARGHNGEGVLVSVVDSPFQLDHPELDEVFIDGYNIDDDSFSAGVCSDNTTISCDRSHGTHVAGIIAASRDNTTGMHGVAYEAKIKPIAFITGVAHNSLQLADMFENASGMDNGTQIVAMNNSWGPMPEAESTGVGSQVYIVPELRNTTLETMYDSMLPQVADNGTIMVWAAGNDGWNSETGRVEIYADLAAYNDDSIAPISTPLTSDFIDNISLTSANQVDYLAKLPSLVSDNSSYVIDEARDEYRWLTVVATNPTTDEIASFSNGCGEAMAYCMAAPGVGIYATIDGSAYGLKNGTSMATPHVTGAIAVLRDMYPDLEPEEIVAILLRSATDLGASGLDPVYGHGLLNLQKATGPLGAINLASVTSTGTLSLLEMAPEIDMPAPIGNALSEINLALLDEYDRLYSISVPVTANLHERLTLAERMKQAGKSEEDYITLAGGIDLSYQVDDPDDVGAISLHLRQDMGSGRWQTGYSQTIDGEDIAGDEELAFSDDYSRYYLVPAMSQMMDQTSYIGLMQQDNQSGIGVSTGLRTSTNASGGAIMQYSSGWSLTRGGWHSKLTIGGLSESDSLMGAEMAGTFALSDAGSRTVFGRVDVKKQIADRHEWALFYLAARSDVNFINADLIEMQNLRQDSYGASWRSRLNRSGSRAVELKLWRPLAATSGDMMINQVTGYRRSGETEVTATRYSLVPERETAFHADMLWGGLRAGVFHRMNVAHQANIDETGGYLTTSYRF